MDEKTSLMAHFHGQSGNLGKNTPVVMNLQTALCGAQFDQLQTFVARLKSSVQNTASYVASHSSATARTTGYHGISAENIPFGARNMEFPAWPRRPNS